MIYTKDTWPDLEFDSCSVQFVMDYIKSDVDSFDRGTENVKRRRARRKDFDLEQNVGMSLWETTWGRTLKDVRIKDPSSWIAKKFRRRFRIPFSVFDQVLVPMCIEKEVFSLKSRIPIEIKILISLRILARGSCADDIEELSHVPESTVNYIFKQFVTNFSEKFFDTYIIYPTGDQLGEINKVYEGMGFPLCCGSMDVTHIELGKCPVEFTNLCKGKEGYPTLAFQCIVGPHREILYCSFCHFGSFNDVTITHNDPLPIAISRGFLKTVEGIIFSEDNIPKLCKGGYLLVDGGYWKEQWLMCPCPQGGNLRETIWSEWLESIRKDVECTFGMLKQRFRLFLNQVHFHSFFIIEAAWKTACILHNMMLMYNGVDLLDWERNIDWSTVDPDLDMTEYDESMHMMDDYEDPQIIPIPGSRFGRHWLHETTLVGRTFHYNHSSDFDCLRDSLVNHFYHNYLLGLVRWPHRSSISLRLRLRIPRLGVGLNEVQYSHALYVKDSNFRRVNDGTAIGKGLFSCLTYKKGEIIVQYKGRVTTNDEHIQLCCRDNDNGVLRKQYCIGYKIGFIFDCFLMYNLGECKASFANDAKACTDVSSHSNAINNCKISIFGDVISIKADRQVIYPHQELAVSYSSSFNMPMA